MAKKKAKLSTPTWILEGFDSEADYNKAKGITKEKKEGKVFKIKECPKCESDNIGLVLSNSDAEEDSNTGKTWECRKCGWTGTEIVQKELTEDEFMKYLDDKGEEVS
jgi:C4-type Zn-finger protein